MKTRYEFERETARDLFVRSADLDACSACGCERYARLCLSAARELYDVLYGEGDALRDIAKDLLHRSPDGITLGNYIAECSLRGYGEDAVMEAIERFAFDGIFWFGYDGEGEEVMREHREENKVSE